MGLWSFVKGRGKKLFGGGEEPTLDGAALQDEISELGLDASGMEITVDGDTVKVSGDAVSQEMKEKTILAVGNVKGVSAVEDSVPSAGEPVFHTVEKGDTLWAEKTSVILLSDNGFNLGTHGSFHKMSQWDSAAHAPLGLWSARIKEPKVIDWPISLHNIPKTIMDLAGLPYRPDWVSGQSLLPLVDGSFGKFDETKSPVTSVFGTLSV